MKLNSYLSLFLLISFVPPIFCMEKVEQNQLDPHKIAKFESFPAKAVLFYHMGKIKASEKRYYNSVILQTDLQPANTLAEFTYDGATNLQIGFNGPVRSFTVSPNENDKNGQQFAVQACDTVSVWSMTKGIENFHKFEIDEKSTGLSVDLQFSPDGSHLTFSGIGKEEQQMIDWDLTSGKKVNENKYAYTYLGNDGNRALLVHVCKKKASSYRMPHQLITEFDIPNGIRAVSPDTTTIAALNEKGNIQLQDTSTGKLLKGELSTSGVQVKEIAISNLNESVAAGLANSTIANLAKAYTFLPEH